MKTNVMTRAWQIYRTLIGDHVAKISMALRMAWAEVKAAAAAKGWNVEKLIAAGANRWTKGDKDRLYLRKVGKSVMGLEYTYHRSRRTIAEAWMDGQEISNNNARRIENAYADAYIDLTTGQVMGTMDDYAEMFVERLQAAYYAA